ncbi:MAG: peptide chain release factor N(5)-glutamine methyltransferase [Pseudomonas sp.]|jgi:release factor glutamine methyltransferase|uniref:peptide chain release factor N(5)-glutamine methyltransferase n=1 Tax=Gammaproteobacteria TaxID=1236 RepID=UPI001B5E50EB|nr:peptide chain release factor N(5)-glutamine methyltransferase [Pseudomonas sp.]MBQ0778961.1 peptide chain release factor N(5)-glutamine methyltransferase [Pseudomonas sp.]WOD10774.1 peptide chain release factor N(5)-glutamine methyltransferase [Pseudomonas sp. NyZ704]
MTCIADLLAQVELPDSTTPDLDAQLLLAKVLGKSQSYLRTWPERELDAEQLAAFEQLMARRRQGEPVAYLLGQQGFWSLDLHISPATLIPRADTERLVELALELGPAGAARVLDLGTGSGAIALALAKERSKWQVLGCDTVAQAVELAERNRLAHKLDNARFVQSNWFSALATDIFELIVSNPPYIATTDPHLQQGDVRFEPASALVSGADGLDAVRQIIEQAPAHLHNDGWLLIEHGWDQSAPVCELLQQRGFAAVQSWQDLAGHQRVSGGQWRG